MYLCDLYLSWSFELSIQQIILKKMFSSFKFIEGPRDTEDWSSWRYYILTVIWNWNNISHVCFTVCL